LPKEQVLGVEQPQRSESSEKYYAAYQGVDFRLLECSVVLNFGCLFGAGLLSVFQRAPATTAAGNSLGRVDSGGPYFWVSSICFV
jgi:hypothetical protein